MAAYDTLRAAIDNYIKANGNKEITGTVLNDILNAMVSALGADTRFAGVAVPTTNPGNPEGNVVYFASQAGTYSNFGGIVLPLGIHILVWNGTAWTSQTWFSVDNTPTQNSQNLATSGGILQAIVDAVGVERLRAIGAEVTSCSFDGTTKKISFFNSANDTLFQLDATAFVIDGMVSDVKIENGNLVIQFNTDAGKQDIEIPLTDIFNPANYYTKTAIDALLALYYTKTETDALLTAINNKLADGCLYRGMAEPTTNPPTPTTKVFYIATKAGTYTNFGNIAVTEGITILKYDGSNWSKEQISYSDGVFDISAYNGTSYADLSAALGTNGANIPENLRKGGMSVKFVQSSDNKYVQYRLMAQSFSATPSDWQGVDDEPTAGSENLVKSSGTAAHINDISQFVIPSISGDIIELLHFVNGNAISGHTVIDYGVAKRIISDRIAANVNNTNIYVDITDTTKKVAITYMKSSTKTFEVYQSWTSGSFSFNTFYSDADYFVIIIANRDDTAITPNDISGIQFISNVENTNDFLLYSTTTPNVNTYNNTLDLGESPIFHFGNTTISLADVIEDPTQYRAIRLTNNVSRYSYIIFNTVDYTFRAAKRDIQNNDTDLILGSYDSQNRKNCYFKFNYTIDGVSWSDLDNSPEITSKKMVTSSGIRNADMEMNQYILPMANGDITDLLHFVNGGAISGGSVINYGAPKRIISDKISANFPDSEIEVIISDMSLRCMVLYMDGQTGVYGAHKTWTSESFSFNASGDNIDHFLILIAKVDDTAITPDDISGIKVRSTVLGIDGNGILDFNQPKDFIPKLLNVTRRYVYYGGSVNDNPPCLSLIHFSDIHADNTNILRVKEFFDYYAAYVDDVVQTGDLIGISFTDGMPSAYASTPDILNVIGNHDSMNRVGTPPNHHWELVDQKSVYDVVIAPYASGWGVIQPVGAEENGYCYYYKDYTQQKVRLIVLDCMHWDSTQNSWLADTLDDARQSDYHVLIGVHYPPFKASHNADNTFDSLQKDTNIGGTTNIQAANTVKAFIDNGGVFVCWLCGHIHQDVMGVGLAGSGYENQLVISIATASVAPSISYSEMGRSNGNKTQDCFNVIGIDTTSKTLKIARVGADYDMYMRKKDVMSWDYENSRLIYVL